MLNISVHASRDDINRAYRTSSLLVHPDKVSSSMREKAEKAFSWLGAAKDELMEEEKAIHIKQLVETAQEKLQQQSSKRLKTSVNNSVSAGSSSGDGAEDTSASLPPSSASASTSTASTSLERELGSVEYERRMRDEMKELLIDREWRKRQLLKAAVQQDVLAAQAKEIRVSEREEREREEKEWEDNRDKRINNWRNFQKTGVKVREE